MRYVIDISDNIMKSELMSNYINTCIDAFEKSIKLAEDAVHGTNYNWNATPACSDDADIDRDDYWDTFHKA